MINLLMLQGNISQKIQSDSNFRDLLYLYNKWIDLLVNMFPINVIVNFPQNLTILKGIFNLCKSKIIQNSLT